MSITYSGAARTGVGIKNKLRGRLQLVAAVALAGLVVLFVASFFEPFSDEQLQRMQLEQTRDLPQNR